LRHRFTAIGSAAALTVILLSGLVSPFATSHGSTAAFSTEPTGIPMHSSNEIQTNPVVTIGDAKTMVNEVGNVEITIHEATTGLAGYHITVSLSDDQVAEVVDIVLPDFGLTDEAISSPSTARIRAVDVKDIVPFGTNEARLAVLKVKGWKSGISEVLVTVYAMDDDNGDPIEPRIVPGSVEVTLIAATTPEPSAANWSLIGGITGAVVVIGLCIGLFTTRRKRVAVDKVSPNETENTD